MIGLNLEVPLFLGFIVEAREYRRRHGSEEMLFSTKLERRIKTGVERKDELKVQHSLNSLPASVNSPCDGWADVFECL